MLAIEIFGSISLGNDRAAFSNALQPTRAIEKVGATHQALPPANAVWMQSWTPSLVFPNRLPAQSIFQRASDSATFFCASCKGGNSGAYIGI